MRRALLCTCTQANVLHQHQAARIRGQVNRYVKIIQVGIREETKKEKTNQKNIYQTTIISLKLNERGTRVNTCFSMCKVLGLIPRMAKKKKKSYMNESQCIPFFNHLHDQVTIGKPVLYSTSQGSKLLICHVSKK